MVVLKQAQIAHGANSLLRAINKRAESAGEEARVGEHQHERGIKWKASPS